MNIVFNNSNKYAAIHGMLLVPLKGTVTQCDVIIDNKIFYTTKVIDKTIIEQYQNKQHKLSHKIPNFGTDIEDYIPDLFRLPINNIPKHSSIEISINYYIENLDYINGNYEYNCLLSFHPLLLQGDINSIITFQGAISKKIVDASHLLSHTHTLYDMKADNFYLYFKRKLIIILKLPI